MAAIGYFKIRNPARRDRAAARVLRLSSADAGDFVFDLELSFFEAVDFQIVGMGSAEFLFQCGIERLVPLLQGLDPLL
jgi:hypothetical protein